MLSCDNYLVPAVRCNTKSDFLLSFQSHIGYIARVMNTPTHFLFFDEYENKWVQATTDELSMRNDPDLYVIPIYENNQQGEQCTWQDWPKQQKARDLKLKEQQEEERRKAEANKPTIYEYEVIEHTKYKGLAGNEFDVNGLREKINALAVQGYRLVTACAPTTLQNQTMNSVFGGGSGISLHGVVAIMERPKK